MSSNLKKILAFSLLLILFCALSCFACADEGLIASGTCGENLTWELDAEGVLAISGTGDMYDFDNDIIIVPWNSYRNKIKEVVIYNGATSIGTFAFESCESLLKIEIPNSVASIGHCAFSNCISLSNIKMSINITNIGIWAFSNCRNLSSIEIPCGLKRLESHIFSQCVGLSSINISCGVETIGDGAFWNCNSLTSISIPSGVTTIEESAFASCASLTSVVIPESVKEIGNYTFENCGELDSINLPDNVTNIGNGAFSNCSKLSSIVIPSGVVSIQPETFSACSSLTSIVLPSTLEKIGEWAFANCRSLISVAIPSEVKIIENDAFRGCSSLSCISIPSNVINIGECCFSDCSKLTNVEILSNVLNIENCAFERCCALGNVYFSGTEAQWNTISIGSYNDAIKNAKIHFRLIASGTCGENLTWELDNDGVLTISGEGAMDDYEQSYIFSSPWYNIKNEITAVRINEGVTNIGNGAFADCNNLTSISIPSSITSIGNFAFYNCGSLQKIDFSTSVTNIGGNAFRGSGVTTIIIPDSVTNIGEFAFYMCQNLTSITLSQNLIDIEQYTFGYCGGLKGIIIPDSVINIGNLAFTNCSNLKSIVFAGNAPRFNDYSFANFVATIYYCANTSGWTDVVNYFSDGPITWVALPVEDAENAEVSFAAAKDYYFGKSAELGIDADALNAVSANLLSSYQSPATGSLPDGISYEGTSLTLEDTVMVRHFFTLSGDVENYTFKLGTTVVTPVQRGQYYTVDIAGIPFSALNQPHTIEVISGSSQWSMSYCPLSYAYKALAAGTDDNLCTLMKAMYLYYFALNAS